jgi:glycosyltransferase involved in cell wall biosynthesis
MPDVSVIVPTHNRRGMVQQAVGSALAQQGASVEVIVVDDGSSDGTEEVLRRLSDPRVRVEHLPHSGVATARNRGIAMASADWIAFLDDDDYWAPGKLARQLAAAAAEDVALVCCGAWQVDRYGRLIGTLPSCQSSDLPAQLYEHNVVGPPSGVMVRSSAVRNGGGFDPAFSVFADWDLYLRVIEQGGVVAVEERLYAYRIHGANMQFAEIDHLGAEFERLQAKQSRRRAKGLDAVVGSREIDRWMAYCYRETGRTRDAARVYLRNGVRRCNPRDLARGLVFGALGNRAPRHFRAPRRDPRLSPPEWLLAAQREIEAASPVASPSPVSDSPANV